MSLTVPLVGKKKNWPKNDLYLYPRALNSADKSTLLTPDSILLNDPAKLPDPS